MRAYIAGRLATAVLVILGVSVVSFCLTFLTGDPAEIMLPPGATATQIATFRAEWGFDDPLPVQYWRFLARALQGDFGISLRHGQSALPLIEELPQAALRSETLAFSVEPCAFSEAFSGPALTPLLCMSAIFRSWVNSGWSACRAMLKAIGFSFGI